MTRPDTTTKAILFDLDGTLIDTDDHAVKLLTRRLTPLARLLSFDANCLARRIMMWAETPGNALVTLLDTVGLDDNVFVISDTLHRWRGLYPRHNVPLIPGVNTALRALSEHYRLAIVTTRGNRDAQAFLAQHSLAPLFDVVVTRESTRHLKPHPEPVQFAAQCLNLSPQSCAMVGDTVVDVRSARAAGAKAVAVLCGFGERDELEKEGAYAILTSTAAMPDVFLPSELRHLPSTSGSGGEANS
jgi:HAD superfamily hydrolase (TIGR01509 family)